MPQLTSSDRTSIAYEQTGHGPAVVLIHVGPFTQALNAGLAGLLAGRFTVYTYDRRGRGASGGTITDGPDREFDDLRAVIDHAGGHAHVYGSSGAGIIALQAASRRLPISRLAVWEPPYAVATPNPPADWGPQIASLIAAGRRGDGVAYWMTTILGMPEPADELHIWLHPLLVGNTDPRDHIGAVGAASPWQLDDMRRHDSGLVILSYRQLL